jgi:hypothetical protein
MLNLWRVTFCFYPHYNIIPPCTFNSRTAEETAAKAKAAAAAEEEERKKVLGAVVCARVLDSHAVLRSLLTRKSLHRFTPFLDNAFFLLTPLAPISSAFCSRFFVSFFKFTLGPRGGRCEVGSKERRRGRPCCRG